MSGKRSLSALGFSAVILVTLLLVACSSGASTPPGTTSTSPGGGGGDTVVRSDCIISGELQAIRQQSTGYPFSVDVFIFSSDNVDSLPNPTFDKVGQVITAETDENMESFKPGQRISAHVKYVGDVPSPGISLYLFNITAGPTPAAFSLGQQFTLKIGDSVSIQDEALTFTFMNITSDSRCPNDATCIWAGEVNSLVEVTQDGIQAASLVLTQPGLTDQPTTQDYAGYTLTFKVTPYPKADVPIAHGDYQLTMTVAKSTGSNVEINPAPINDVKIAVTLNSPREVLVYIKGGLRDTCTTFDSLNTDRTGTSINIQVKVRHATDQICGQVYTFFERCVDLGSDFVSGQTYTVVVNDMTTTFTMP